MMDKPANANRKLPASIWTIFDVIEPPTDMSGAKLYEIWIRRRGVSDVLIVYSREGAAPQVDGLPERMTRPKGGLTSLLKQDFAPEIPFVH